MVTDGIQNIPISELLNFSAHMDEIIICDIGFPIPKNVNYIDLVIKDDIPTVLDVLDEILKHFSVEKVVLAEEAEYYNPSYVKKVLGRFDKNTMISYIPHTQFKERSHKVKGIIRTGDYTANSNVLLVSADSGKFHRECNNEAAK